MKEKGLRVSTVLDGAGAAIEELVRSRRAVHVPLGLKRKRQKGVSISLSLGSHGGRVALAPRGGALRDVRGHGEGVSAPPACVWRRREGARAMPVSASVHAAGTLGLPVRPALDSKEIEVDTP